MSTGSRGSDGRFPAGQSGNANDGSRKAATVSAAIVSAMNKTITANEHGRKRKFRKLDATATQITELCMDMRKLVGRNVRAARVERGITQEQLAEASGFTHQYISELERRNPTIVTIYELAQALGVTPVALLTP